MVYWVLPLFNFMPGWRNPSTLPQDFVSRTERLKKASGSLPGGTKWIPGARTDGGYVIPFRLNGRAAFVEPMPNYEESRRRLLEGRERRLVTAVAVGEVGDRDARRSALWDWFPIDIFEVLGFANGIPVGSPCVEFRDAQGGILRRHAINFGHPVFYKGRPVIDAGVHGGVGELLTRFLSLPAGERLYLRAAMSHATRGGLRSQDIEDRLASLFRGFESVCKAQGLDGQNLAQELDEENRALVQRTLRNVAQELRAAATSMRSEHDTRQAEALDAIASRVQSANNKDKSFGSQLRELLGRLGLYDAEAMETHPWVRTGGTAPASWLQTVNRYRNDVVHDGYLDIYGGSYDEEQIEGAMVHLHDLLVRVVLKLLGYGGDYQPTVSMSLASKTIDWVTPETPPASLGYHRG